MRTGVHQWRVSPLLVVTVALLSMAAQSPRRELIPIFDAYERSQHGLALEGLTQHQDLRALKTQIAAPRESGAWIARAGGTADRRRVIVATVAIEAVNRYGVGQWADAYALVEWACALVRQNAPGAVEAAWQRASIALVQSGSGVISDQLEIHTGHAFKRFPTDPQVVLARAVARELRTFPDPRDGSLPSDRDERVDAIIDYLQDARAYPEVRDEASMRLGFLYLRIGQPGLAVKTLDEAGRERGEPQIVYLSHLFRGRALERLDRDAEAVDAYRAAVAAVPGAQTAALALAAALVKVGQRTAAADIAQQSVIMPAQDPWFFYGKTSTRRWPALLDALREALR
jgi:tetratricopeptide (TPR) repeat protein